MYWLPHSTQHHHKQADHLAHSPFTHTGLVLLVLPVAQVRVAVSNFQATKAQTTSHPPHTRQLLRHHDPKTTAAPPPPPAGHLPSPADRAWLHAITQHQHKHMHNRKTKKKSSNNTRGRPPLPHHPHPRLSLGPAPNPRRNRRLRCFLWPGTPPFHLGAVLSDHCPVKRRRGGQRTHWLYLGFCRPTVQARAFGHHGGT